MVFPIISAALKDEKHLSIHLEALNVTIITYIFIGSDRF